MFDHEFDGFVIDVRAVLDGAHAGEHGLPYALRGVGVRRHRHAEPPRFGNCGVQLFRAEGDIARVVADRLEGARYQQLDPVGAELDLAADCLADFLRAIGDQAIGDYRLLRRGEVDVSTAASDGDVMPRTRDARPAEYARLDHLAKVLVCIVDVDV